MPRPADEATSTVPTTWVMAIAGGAMVLGYVLGAVIGWPVSGGDSTPEGALALMCATLEEVEPSFPERLEAGDVDIMGPTDDARSASLLVATVDLTEAAAVAEGGDENLRAAAQELRQSLERLEGAAVRAQVNELQQYC